MVHFTENSIAMPQEIKQNYFMTQYFQMMHMPQRRERGGFGRYLHISDHSSAVHNIKSR